MARITRALIQGVANRRQCLLKAAIVGDAPLLTDGQIEIEADENAAAREGDVFH